MTDFTQLPADLPVPEDDGAAAHLPGRQVPDVTLAATSDEAVALGELGPGRTIVYIYPMTGQPDVDLPDGWDNIPGARGCTTEACDFRDHHADLLDAGAARVFGVFMAMTLVWLCSYALLAAKASSTLQRPPVARALERFTGVVLIGLGVRLATESR